MARISGVDLPREKRVEIGLTYIYGIGLTSSKDILAKTGINPDTRVKDLTEDDVAKLREELACEYIDTVASPYEACKASLVEDIIAPADTRAALITALEMLSDKRTFGLPKKHSN